MGTLMNIVTQMMIVNEVEIRSERTKEVTTAWEKKRQALPTYDWRVIFLFHYGERMGN